MGQIPHKLAKVDNENPLDVTTPDEDFEENRDFHPNSGQKSKEVDYLNPSRNPNGRVVITPDPQRAQFYQLGNDPRIIDVSVETYGTVKVFMAKDIVTFMHPKFRDHEVICDNIEKVKINLFFSFKVVLFLFLTKVFNQGPFSNRELSSMQQLQIGNLHGY